MAETIETTWGQVGKILKQKGRRAASRKVKLIIDHTPEEDVVKIQEQLQKPTNQQTRQTEQLKQLHELMNNPTGVGHHVDDSRDSIYEEVIRDTR